MRRLRIFYGGREHAEIEEFFTAVECMHRSHERGLLYSIEAKVADEESAVK